MIVETDLPMVISIIANFDAGWHAALWPNRRLSNLVDHETGITS